MGYNAPQMPQYPAPGGSPVGPRPQSAVPSQLSAGMSRAAAAIIFWLKQQRSKYYWKVLLAGIAAWILSGSIAASTSNLLAPPQVMLIGASVVPLCVLIFWYEESGATVPLILLLLAVTGGVTVGLSLGGLFDTSFASGSASLWDGIMVGICEETAKAFVILLFLRSTRLTNSLHGLLIGVSVGAGFAIGETMGYAFYVFSQTSADGGDFGSALSLMNSALLDRGALAIFGHVTWAGIVGAAVWRERRGSTFNLTSGVALAFGIAVVMHGLWDGTNFLGWPIVSLGQLEFPLFDTLVVGPLGLITLSFFVHEARRRARMATPPPLPPLAGALKDYYRHLGIFLGLLPSEPRKIPAVPSSPLPSMPYGMVPPPPYGMAPPPTSSGTAWPSGPSPAQPGAQSIPGIICPQCGTWSAAGTRFCSRCGRPLSVPSPNP
jgi:protease PrsW